MQQPSYRAWLIAIERSHRISTGLIALASFILCVIVLIRSYAAMRQQAIKYENDPQYYLWEEDAETGAINPRF